MRGSSSFALRTRRLRFACASARAPKSRGIAGFSGAAPRCECAVSAAADSVAERVIFALSVPLSEAGANADSPAWRPRSLNSRYGYPDFGLVDWANRKRIGTAQLGNRDKLVSRRYWRPEPAVSGPGWPRPNSQHPAESRSFLGLYPSVRRKSLQQQTRWRRGWDSNPRYRCRYA